MTGRGCTVRDGQLGGFVTVTCDQAGAVSTLVSRTRHRIDVQESWLADRSIDMAAAVASFMNLLRKA